MLPKTSQRKSKDSDEVVLELNCNTNGDDRRQRYKLVFDRYDTNNDGFWDLKEIKVMIRDLIATDLPKDIATQILGDTDNDGHLNFEEFYRMTFQKNFFMKRYSIMYCKLVLPWRDSRPARNNELYWDYVTFFPPPLTMLFFSIVQLCFFHFEWAKSHLEYDLKSRAQVWRFITYMFTHGDSNHILMNLVVQLFVGIPLELVHHWWRVTIIYIAGVLAGSMMYFSEGELMGASGGVFALLAAHIATLILNYKEMEYFFFQFGVIVCFCVMELCFFCLNENSQTSHSTHFWGVVAGLLIGIGVLRNLEERQWERYLWWIAVISFVTLMLTGVAMHVFSLD